MASYSRLDDDTLMIEDARIIFRNFEGRPGRYNQEGRKNFGVVIEDQAVADQLDAEDWNIKVLDPRDEDEGPTPWVPVKVDYERGRPPKLVMVTTNNRRVLTEEDVTMLDNIDFSQIDMILRPYRWNNPDGRSGISAYLKSMYVVIEEDPLDIKYSTFDK